MHKCWYDTVNELRNFYVACEIRMCVYSLYGVPIIIPMSEWVSERGKNDRKVKIHWNKLLSRVFIRLQCVCLCGALSVVSFSGSHIHTVHLDRHTYTTTFIHRFFMLHSTAISSAGQPLCGCYFFTSSQRIHFFSIRLIFSQFLFGPHFIQSFSEHTMSK